MSQDDVRLLEFAENPSVCWILEECHMLEELQDV